jgi:pimeloyl-ACP methyl ester carboxylesterase
LQNHTDTSQNIRKYGSSPFNIVVIHGGPGAAGSLTPVARELSKNSGILEPFQTRRTIEGQIQELKVILEIQGEPPYTLIGHSWGAWLGYIYASRYPSGVRKLIMIGSGPFLERYARGIINTRMQRLTVNERTELTTLLNSLEDPAIRDTDNTFMKAADLIRKADSFSPIDLPEASIQCRYDIFQSIWKEAEELRNSGELLNLAVKIRCPVTVIHGDYDPHPFKGIVEPLSSRIKSFKFALLEKCGHEPWNERYAKEEFYSILMQEIGLAGVRREA